MGATDYPVGAGPNSGGPREIAVQRAQEVEKLRQSIREAATRLFAKSGYHGTTVKQIADEVGISKQLLLYHFSSKEALRAAVLHELLQAWNELLPIVYDELRVIAAHRLRCLKPGETLQTTALVHEAYIKMAANEAPSFENRRHFFAAAARSMKNILIDEARSKCLYV